jgi:hypothetical protein
MQDSPGQPVGMMRRVLIGLGCVLLIGAIGLGTAVVLKNIIPKKDTQIAMTVWKPSEIVSAYMVSGAIHGLADNLYQLQQSSGTDALVQYTLPGRAYAASTPTKSDALFYAKDMSNHDDVAAVQQQTTVFMQTKGYDKVKSTGSSGSDGPFYTTYASSSAVCQLLSSGPVAGGVAPVSHELTCVDQSAIEQEYATIEKLLALSKTAHATVTAFTLATRSVLTEGKKAMTILNLVATQKPSVLLFASVNDQWAYIGNLSGDTGQSNSKYVLTPEIKTAIRDPKYGDFLTKNLEGSSL